MKKSKLLLGLILCLFYSGFVLGQDPAPPFDPSQKLIPPAPEVAALSKYAEIPVSLYTGTPNISIPLGVAEGEKLQLPISLSYYAGGIKVDEVASTTGLGWSLNAGGVISRTIMGLPDEHQNGYNNYTFPTNLYTIDINAESALMEGVAGGSIDGQPDQYYFNVAGYAGKFIYVNGEVHTIPHQNIKIERQYNTFIGSEINQWTITTPDGNIFQFGEHGATEQTASSTYGCGEDATSAALNGVTAWHLTTMTSADGQDDIKFIYQDNAVSYKSGITQTKYYSLGLGICSNPPPPSTCEHELSTGTKKLTNILTSTSQIDFEYSSGREDLPGGWQLDRINFTKNELWVKRFDLGYDYFSSGPGTPELKKRLKLMSVQEHGINGLGNAGNPLSIPPYEFTYLDGSVDADYKLPPRLSFAQDHWGFYNGETSNTDLLPYAFIPGIGIIDGNRDAHPKHSKAGMLSKIQYPSGGYTEFEFEGHQRGDFDVFDTDEMPTYINRMTETAVASNAYQLTTKTIYISHETAVYVSYTKENTLFQGDFGGSLRFEDASGTNYLTATGVHYYNADGEEIIHLQPGTYTLYAEAGNPGDIATLNVWWDENQFRRVGPGGLDINTHSGIPIGGCRIQKMTVHDGVTSDHSNDIVKVYNYDKYSSPGRSSGRLISDPKYLFGYGEHRGMNTVPCLSRICAAMGLSSSPRAPLGSSQGSHIIYENATILYGNAGENGKTEHVFSFFGDRDLNGSPWGPGTSYDWKRGNLLRQTDYKNTSGNWIKVKETENTYNYRENETVNNHKSTAIIVSKGNRNDPCPPVPFVTCDAASVTNPNTVCFGHNPGDVINGPGYAAQFRYRFYDVISNWTYLESTTEKVFDNAGQNALVTSTSYVYDDPISLQPTETSVVNSDGIKYISRTRYASMYNTSSVTDITSQAIKLLQEKFMNATPIETANYIVNSGSTTERFTSGQLNIFRTIVNGSLTMPMLKEVYGSETESPVTSYSPSTIQSGSFTFDTNLFKRKGSITNYTDNFKVEEYQREGDIHSALLWGYNDYRVIAKGINAKANELFYTSFEEQSKLAKDNGNWHIFSLPNTPVVWNTANYQTGQQSLELGSHAVVANVGSANTYKLAFWYKGNATIKVGGTNHSSQPQATTDWTWFETVFPVNSGQTVEIYGNTGDFVDELRLYPAEGFMLTYTYTPKTLMVNSITNEAGISAHYSYDQLQRLQYAFDQDRNLITTYEYHYKDGSDPYNYVKNQIFEIPGLNTSSNLNAVAIEDKTVGVQYYDGIGRVIQNVAVQASNNKSDIIQIQKYDQFGRAAKQHLPFTVNRTAALQGSFDEQADFHLDHFYQNQVNYEAQTTIPYTESRFDNSPLNQVLETAMAGENWQMGSGNTRSESTRLNLSNEVIKFSWTSNGFTRDGFYAANELFVSIRTNEKGDKTFIYSDKFGRTILLKNEVDGTSTLTQTVYNELGRISLIIPPLAMEKIVDNSNILTPLTHNSTDNLIYYYVYDKRGRVKEKKTPGAESKYFVYDNLDRLILSQEGNQRPLNRWLFTKYDILNRPIMTGWTTEGDSRGQLQTTLDNLPNSNSEGRSSSNIATMYGYSNNALPLLSGNHEILSITYYDDYDFNRDGIIDVENQFVNDSEYPNNIPFLRLHGEITGSFVKVLDGGDQFLKTINFFDRFGQTIQVQADHQLGKDVINSEFDFSGKLLKSKRLHQIASTSLGSSNILEIRQRFDYDHSGRLTKTYHKVGNQDEVLLVSNSFNRRDQLREKNLYSTNNGNTFLQSIDYDYNIHGWMKSINNVTNLLSSETGTIGDDSARNNSLEINYKNGSLATEDIVIKTRGDHAKDGSTIEKSSSKTVNLEGSIIGSSTNEKITVDYTSEVTKDNMSDALDEIETLVGNELAAKGITDADEVEALLQKVRDQYRDQWLDLRINAGNDDNNDLMAMYFHYDPTGNIENMQWRTFGNSFRSIYDVSYDEMSRITAANYKEFTDSGNYRNTGNYDVANITYDKNSNILTLNRIGQLNGTNTPGTIDQLNYTYVNNQLQKVADGSNRSEGFSDGSNALHDYVHDANGNITTDNNKGITISYNHLNLPTTIAFSDGKQISYVYDAVGVKLKKIVMIMKEELLQKTIFLELSIKILFLNL